MTRRVLDDDGLTVVEAIDQDSPLADYPEWMLRDAPFGGFDQAARWIEAFCQPYAATQPGTKPLSIGAQARKVRWLLDQVRAGVRTSPDIRRPVLAAMKVGYYYAVLRWRLHWGDLTRTGRSRRRHDRKSGLLSGRARRPARNARHQKIVVAARLRRRTHSDRTKLTTHGLAKQVAADTKIPLGTVRRVLRKHNID